MKFTARIGSGIVGLRRKAGLRELALVRAKYGPDVQAEQVCPLIDWIFEAPTIELTEQEAQESGRFDDSSEIAVKVEGDFSEFIGISVERIGAHPADYKLKYYIDHPALKAAWIEAGCPMEWIRQTGGEASKSHEISGPLLKSHGILGGLLKSHGILGALLNLRRRS